MKNIELKNYNLKCKSDRKDQILTTKKQLNNDPKDK